MPVASRQHNLPSLDGMRATSIFLVMFAHCAGTPHAYPVGILFYTGEIGVLGVKVFFVISGFLITSLLLKEQEKTGAISLGRFYLRRILRIFPAFYTLLITVRLFTHFGVLQVRAIDFLRAATFTANTAPMGWELLHAWSLSLEEQFYLLWPASLVLFGARASLRVTVALVCIMPIFFGFALHGHMRLGEAVSGLAAGCVLAGFRGSLHQKQSYLRFLGDKRAAALLALALLITESLHRFWFYELLAPLISVGIAVLLDSVVTFPALPLGRFLNLKPVAYIGVLSYSIYLWQEIFFNRWGTHWFNVFPLNVLCVAVCSLASFYLIEKPFLTIKDRLRPRPKLTPPAAPQAQTA